MEARPLRQSHGSGSHDDAKGSLVHAALSGIEDEAVRARLESIPTGLTLPNADVDALAAFGERLVRAQPELGAIAASAGPGMGRLDPPAPPATAPAGAARRP